MDNKKGFVVPKETLDKLNEFSGGGFILFIYDENQVPQPYASFDTLAHGLGMQRFLENWAEAVNIVNIENTTQLLLNMNSQDSSAPHTGNAGDEPADESA